MTLGASTLASVPLGGSLESAAVVARSAGLVSSAPVLVEPLALNVAIKVGGFSLTSRIQTPTITTGAGVRFVVPSVRSRSTHSAKVQVRTIHNPTRQQIESLLSVI